MPLAFDTGVRVRLDREHRRRLQTYRRGVLVLLALIAGLFLTSLAVGEVAVPLGDLARMAAGMETASSRFIVTGLRLPRALGALVVGACFGLSGALLQSLLRNPLASPDVIGVTGGASASAVFVIMTVGMSGSRIMFGAFAGGLACALFIYLLAWRGGTNPYRFVLVGIGVSAFMSAAVSYMLISSDIVTAQQTFVWLTGTLNGLSWGRLSLLLPWALVLVPVGLCLSRLLTTLAMGDEVSAGLGLAVGPARALVLLIGTGLASVATAAAGPVAFVALVAPPLSRLFVANRNGLLPAALTGAAMLLAADLAAQNMPGLPQLPVGAVTGLIGAPYLIWRLMSARLNP